RREIGSADRLMEHLARQGTARCLERVDRAIDRKPVEVVADLQAGGECLELVEMEVVARGEGDARRIHDRTVRLAGKPRDGHGVRKDVEGGYTFCHLRCRSGPFHRLPACGHSFELSRREALAEDVAQLFDARAVIGDRSCKITEWNRSQQARNLFEQEILYAQIEVE